MTAPLMPEPVAYDLRMTSLDASPSRERLSRVVELLRGVEEDVAVRRPVARSPRRRSSGVRRR